MELGPWDHLLAFTFAVVFPAISIPLYVHRRPALQAGVAGMKLREYRDTVLWLGGMGACTLVVWGSSGRPWSALGLARSFSGPFLWAAAGALVLLAFFAYQLRTVRSDAHARESVRAQLAAVDDFMPATAQELRVFTAVAASAALGEELFYRGFLLWYLGSALPVAAAVSVSSLLFGLGHVMHGSSAAWRAALLGVVFCGLYLWTGTLWIPMLLHAAIDWFSGRAGFASRSPVAALHGVVRFAARR